MSKEPAPAPTFDLGSHAITKVGVDHIRDIFFDEDGKAQVSLQSGSSLRLPHEVARELQQAWSAYLADKRAKEQAAKKQRAA